MQVVYCKQCKAYKTHDQITFIDIEEDMEGRDVLTFICKDCNTQQTSLVLGN